MIKIQKGNKYSTENIDEYNNFLMTLNCNGGGDEHEDVVGALTQALKMNWATNFKFAVLVCDDPYRKKYYIFYNFK